MSENQKKIIRENFEIEGMTCTACAAAIERKVKSLNGIDSAVVNFATEKLVVNYEPSEISLNQIEESVKSIGYKVIPELPAAQAPSSRRSDRDRAEEQLHEKKKQMVVALIFAVPLFYLSMGPMMGLPIPSFLSGDQNILVNVLTQLLQSAPARPSSIRCTCFTRCSGPCPTGTRWRSLTICTTSTSKAQSSLSR